MDGLSSVLQWVAWMSQSEREDTVNARCLSAVLPVIASKLHFNTQDTHTRHMMNTQRLDYNLTRSTITISESICPSQLVSLLTED